MAKLSERVRPDVEAAPWVIDEIKKLEDKLDSMNCTMGVGDGSGNLFVHGDYDSIKACQKLIDRPRLIREDIIVLEEILQFACLGVKQINSELVGSLYPSINNTKLCLAREIIEKLKNS